MGQRRPRRSDARPSRRSAATAAIARRIAHLAARLMAEHGIDDYAPPSARPRARPGCRTRRAARRRRDRGGAARRTRRSIGGDEQSRRLRALREEALRVDARLRGVPTAAGRSVLAGTAATEHSDINLQLFADDAKARRDVPAQRGSLPLSTQARRRVRRGDATRRRRRDRARRDDGTVIGSPCSTLDDERARQRATRRTDEPLERARAAPRSKRCSPPTEPLYRRLASASAPRRARSR